MPSVEIHIINYLEKLDAQLADLPPARRADIVSETREHLEAMMSARRADGFGEIESWQIARAAFGDADAIGREVSREWQRAPRVETVGVPLTKRQKLELFARPMAFLVVMSALYSWFIISQHLESHWQNGFMALVFCSCGFLGLSHWRRDGGQWTTRTITSATTFVFALLWFILDLLFGSELRGTFLGDVLASNWSIAILFAAVMVLRRRVAKEAHPWRNSPQYAQNPVAAEETHRLTPKLALVMGSTVACIGFLWMGWKFMGFGFASMMCVMEILITSLFLRRTS